jgi:hypothetical protein
VLLCAKRPLFFSLSADFIFFSLGDGGAPVAFFLAPLMYFALYGLEMDVWNTLFTLLGSTLVICAAKFISRVCLLRFRSFGRRPSDLGAITLFVRRLATRAGWCQKLDTLLDLSAPRTAPFSLFIYFYTLSRRRGACAHF